MSTCARCGARMVPLVYSEVCADACERGVPAAPIGARGVREGTHRRWVRLHRGESPPDDCIGWDIITITASLPADKAKGYADQAFAALPDPDTPWSVHDWMITVNGRASLFPPSRWRDDDGEGWYLEDV